MFQEEEKLAVLVCISNPMNFKSRIHLYDEFRKYVEKEPNAVLYTVELIYEGQDYCITSRYNPNHLQLKGEDFVWHKENMLNLLADRIVLKDPRVKYLSWIDADVLFARQDWVKATIAALKDHDVVQMFSECRDLTPTFETIPNAVQKGIIHQHKHNPKFGLADGAYTKRTGHTGYAWACTREAWLKMQGLIDFSIMGSADYQMACGWLGDALASTYGGAYSEDYCQAIASWGERVKGFKLGWVDGLCLHNYHGAKVNRGYNWRWKVLVDAQYSPKNDIIFEDGVMKLDKKSTNYLFLKEQLLSYFSSRNEDEHLEVL